MSDLYGPLELPVPAPVAGAAAGDPLLDILLEALKAVINAETKTAWQAVYKTSHPNETERLPVRFTFPQDPRKLASTFNSNKLPALYAWRLNNPRHVTISQGKWWRQSVIAVMWVMPPAVRDDVLIRDAFGNAIDAAVHKFLANERHPAWVRSGDTHGDAATRGSILAYHTKHVSLEFQQSDVAQLELGYVDSAEKTRPFEAWFMRFLVVEQRGRDTSVYDPLDRVEVDLVVKPGALAGEPASRTVAEGDFDIVLDSITPSSGSVAGGTPITVKGKQLSLVTSLTIAGTAVGSLIVVNDTTLTATTPPSAATGAKDVVAMRGAVGDFATLAGGFTYT